MFVSCNSNYIVQNTGRVKCRCLHNTYTFPDGRVILKFAVALTLPIFVVDKTNALCLLSNTDGIGFRIVYLENLKEEEYLVVYRISVLK